jgi:DNA helicase-2/ATP-dependent DNA helicase PcrA
MPLTGNMSKNKLIIAAAGSGKTTLLVEQAKKIKDDNVLITTYTESNEAEIRNKFNGRIPENITIQTWFSFLLQHGVRPYQYVMHNDLHEKKIGFYLTSEKSGRKYDSVGKPIKTKEGKPIYWGEYDFFKFYFTDNLKIYSDKISKFIVECDKKTTGEIIKRIASIYPHIYIDEIQDLAGWELEILKLLFNSKSNILLVGDPRQVVYLTHHPGKHKDYRDGKIKEFIENKCNTKKKIICFIDETTLQKSHRNNKSICDFSSALYPNYAASEPCDCEECRKEIPDHQGIFLVKTKEKEEYCKKYSPIILREKLAVHPEWNYGKSKGLSFDRVLIYPTEKIRNYLIQGDIKEIETIKAKFYVALTRARYSVGIIYDYDEKVNYIEGLEKYEVAG